MTSRAYDYLARGDWQPTSPERSVARDLLADLPATVDKVDGDAVRQRWAADTLRLIRQTIVDRGPEIYRDGQSLYGLLRSVLFELKPLDVAGSVEYQRVTAVGDTSEAEQWLREVLPDLGVRLASAEVAVDQLRRTLREVAA
jgi:hypothetical protein